MEETHLYIAFWGAMACSQCWIATSPPRGFAHISFGFMWICIAIFCISTGGFFNA